MNNYGGFMVVEPYQNRVMNGVNFNMTVEEVIRFVTNNPRRWKEVLDE